MSLAERIPLYKKLETARHGRPLIVYVTSSRTGMAGMMGGDAIPEFMDQLECLPEKTEAVDVLIVSNGGDPLVAWRVITLLRERVKKDDKPGDIAVLVPQAAYSAATLLAMGANEIVMHPNGHLGPVDPQLTVRKQNESEPQNFGFEEMASFLQFAKDNIGLKTEEFLYETFKLLSGEIGSVNVGIAARASILSLSLGEKLLNLHLAGDDAPDRSHKIAESLNKSFPHHGYPLGKTEATNIGLPVAKSNPEVEKIMWAIWMDVESELNMRKPFVPIMELMAKVGKQLMTNVPQARWPVGLGPPQIMMQCPAFSKIMDNIEAVPPVPYEGICGIMESVRHASRFISKGMIIGARQPDLAYRTGIYPESMSWEKMPIPTAK
jgi:hypothetical protein